ncbi:hypothetical protein T4E_5245 [Trichinella pseudospiralis]|uniref:Uncharacterized protein n=1 Tax=Trichinella pseudospiralis TaxID=6337 RepID=A0A0V0XJ66_TRIPS|nr:hypothetical protein T4E_5245 [Trichinella pseudospiralis]
MKVKRLSARFLCCNLHDSSVSSATDNSAARVWKLLRATPQCTQPVSIKNLRPSLVTGSPSLVQENHIISRFMRLSFVFICYMAVTTKIVGSEREKLLQLSILSLQTHDVQRRSSSVPKNRSDEEVCDWARNVHIHCDICFMTSLRTVADDVEICLIIIRRQGLCEGGELRFSSVRWFQWPRLIAQLAIVFRMSCLFSVVLKTGVQ